MSEEKRIEFAVECEKTTLLEAVRKWRACVATNQPRWLESITLDTTKDGNAKAKEAATYAAEMEPTFRKLVEGSTETKAVDTVQTKARALVHDLTEQTRRLKMVGPIVQKNMNTWKSKLAYATAALIFVTGFVVEFFIDVKSYADGRSANYNSEMKYSSIFIVSTLVIVWVAQMIIQMTALQVEKKVITSVDYRARALAKE